MNIPDELTIFLNSEQSAAYVADIVRWMRWRGKSADLEKNGVAAAAVYLLHNFTEFRSITDYRINNSKVFEKRVKVFGQFPRTTDFYIGCESVGPGLIVSHGHGTIIYANSVGRDFFVNQNVTVGHDGKTGIPTIGDRVMIRTGAVVVGAITIGNDVQINANAVVSFDVPDGYKVFSPRSVLVPPKN